jgi:hypothetical protein
MVDFAKSLLPRPLSNKSNRFNCGKKSFFFENGFNLSPAGLREMAAAAIFAQHKSQLKVKTIG